jgi:hypothetical protein
MLNSCDAGEVSGGGGVGKGQIAIPRARHAASETGHARTHLLRGDANLVRLLLSLLLDELHHLVDLAVDLLLVHRARVRTVTRDEGSRDSAR